MALEPIVEAHMATAAAATAPGCTAPIAAVLPAQGGTEAAEERVAKKETVEAIVNPAPIHVLLTLPSTMDGAQETTGNHWYNPRGLSTLGDILILSLDHYKQAVSAGEITIIG